MSCVSFFFLCWNAVPCFPVLFTVLAFLWVTQQLPATKCWGCLPHGDKRWHHSHSFSFLRCAFCFRIPHVMSAFVMVYIQYTHCRLLASPPLPFGKSSKLGEVRDARTFIYTVHNRGEHRRVRRLHHVALLHSIRVVHCEHKYYIKCTCLRPTANGQSIKVHCRRAGH